MSDDDAKTDGPDGTGQGAQPQTAEQSRPHVSILNQFVRDLSFENVAAQKGHPQAAKPDVQVSVGLDAKALGEDRYTVALKINASAKSGENTIFIAEVDYAGTFHVTGVPQQQLHMFLLVECPRLLFPFARRVIADVTRDGGYPPLLLDTVDFVQLYRQEVARRQTETGGGQRDPDAPLM